jgi:hypothetical protein
MLQSPETAAGIKLSHVPWLTLRQGHLIDIDASIYNEVYESTTSLGSCSAAAGDALTVRNK